jgi:hypothetical protein
VEEPVAPPIKLGLLRFGQLAELINLHITNIQITRITADVGNVFHYSACVSDISVKSSHTHVKVLLGK